VSTYKSWQDVGHWYWGLVKDQLYADASLKKTVAELTVGATDTREKATRIYRWVLEHTRYVGLEFGIHGFLPYRVPLIVQRGFGDCKDKASLLYTMLREAGVDARIVLVRTRRNGDIEDLPASLSVFDHAIAYVPSLDLFLDGTAEHSGSTELPEQDQGVHVLVVGPEGAELRRTPDLGAEHDVREVSLDISLGADGAADVTGKERIVGSDAASYRDAYEAVGTRRERFERSMAGGYPGLTLQGFEISSLTELEQPVELNYRMHVPRFASVDGNVLRVAPSALDEMVRAFARTPTRKLPLDLGAAHTYVEERVLHWGEGAAALQAESLPKGGEVKSPFGSFKLDVVKEDHRVVMHTRWVLAQRRIPADAYPAFRAFMQSADSLLRDRLLLRKVSQ
jgi:cellulose synthase operon protein C